MPPEMSNQTLPSLTVRYYQQEQDNMFCYIAMELGIGTVEKYVEGSLELDSEALDKTSILRQASNGLRWLHSRNIGECTGRPCPRLTGW